jgi:hypothetical protein
LILLIVGVYALVTKKVRVTRSFTLTGESARVFGFVLVIGAIPYALLVGAVIPWIVPRSILRDSVLVKLLNVMILAVALFGTAFVFRDRPPNTQVPTGPPDAPPPPEVSP